jgi:Ca2+-transporting ATPase
MTSIDPGLTSEEASRRLKLEGANELPGAQPRNLWSLALDVLREPMFLLLVVAGALYLALGDLREALVLLASVFVVFGITLYQSHRTERTLQALRDLSSPRALVMRDGVSTRIAGREVVRGDCLVLHEGDRIAADAVVRRSEELAVDESLLTGESVPVRKSASEESAITSQPGGDDTPFVYAGTLIVQGQGLAEVTATGGHSQIGRIGKALQALPRESSALQRETARMVKLFATGAFALCITVVTVYGLTRADWMGGLLAGVTLAMGILPEEFPVVLTVFLAFGAWRLSRSNVLTRRPAAIETLGAATVLCVDKTGTLTENRMAVQALQSDDVLFSIDIAADARPPQGGRDVTLYAALACEADPYDPMEKAIIEFARRSVPEADAMRVGWTLAGRYGISPDLLAVTLCWRERDDAPLRIAAKGAPETVFGLCRMTAEQRMLWLTRSGALAERGLRVLGVARALHASSALPRSMRDFDFSFIGLIALADPLRPSVPHAVAACQAAGIRVAMITGDYPVTAQSIARQAGISHAVVLTGTEVAQSDAQALAERVRTVSVFARITPEQKLKLVQAFRASGAVVGMTGDGVNDAPALKAAHIGIAMGGRGTDVAREAASLILLDDRFDSIVTAVALGRRIYDNIRSAMAYLVAVHVPIAGMALLPLLFGWPLMLYPVHIVFLEFVIDPACSIAFEAEPADADAMTRPPRDPKARMFDWGLLGAGVLDGLIALAAVAGVYAGALVTGAPEAQARAMGFATLVLCNLALILVNRSRTSSLVATLRRPNPTLWYVVAGALAALGLAIYATPAAEVFRFGALSAAQLGVCVAAALLAVVCFETIKLAGKLAARGHGLSAAG